MEFNKASLTGLCADICKCIGIEPPSKAESSADVLKKLCGDKICDRVVMYNPDAQAQWLYKKYPEIFASVSERCALEYPLATVMPSVTPVCFATMYTGAYPEVHGIQKYEKPVLKIETIFDALIKSGKKPVIVTAEGASMSKIFLERNMDYFIFPASAEADEQVVKKGIELINKDEHDFIVIYNGMYDSVMHATYPESDEAMEWLKHHTEAFTRIYSAARNVAAECGHTTLIGYATDHGVHTNAKGRGSHGENIPEDINITHFYDIIKS
jgi:predicted AlkP superfamily pyrophosphatase or phosphodiesterase